MLIDQIISYMNDCNVDEIVASDSGNYYSNGKIIEFPFSDEQLSTCMKELSTANADGKLENSIQAFDYKGFAITLVNPPVSIKPNFSIVPLSKVPESSHARNI